jgi:hypothetical protein
LQSVSQDCCSAIAIKLILTYLKSLADSKVLSLSFSRNRVAYAVFARGRLDFYAGKTLRQFRSTRTRNRAFASILKTLVTRHRIQTVSLPKLNKQQLRSRPLRSLHRTAIGFCLMERLSCLILDPIGVRRGITGSTKPTKANAIARIVKDLPELNRYALNTSEWEPKYYGHIFTAIGGGLASVNIEFADDKEVLHE